MILAFFIFIRILGSSFVSELWIIKNKWTAQSKKLSLNVAKTNYIYFFFDPDKNPLLLVVQLR